MLSKNLYDETCKNILSKKSVLANIMIQCIPEYQGMSIEEVIPLIEDGEDTETIKGINSEDTRIEGAKIIYDILFTAMIPHTNDKMYIHIEAQNNSTPGYKIHRRSTYYDSRIVSRQKGEVFNKSDYDSLCKVYSIWILSSGNREQRGSLNIYETQERQIIGDYHSKDDYRLINDIMLYLGDDYDYYNGNKDVLKMLNLLLQNTGLEDHEVSNLLEEDYGIIPS